MTTHFKWPNLARLPPIPETDITRKQTDGAKAGYPRHLCHLLEYEICIVLPDTEATRLYVEWYSACTNSHPIGVMLMPYDEFVTTWGSRRAAKVDAMLHKEGRPSVTWYLIYFIRGFNLATGLWHDKGSPEWKEGLWVNSLRMEDGNCTGNPVFDLFSE